MPYSIITSRHYVRHATTPVACHTIDARAMRVLLPRDAPRSSSNGRQQHMKTKASQRRAQQATKARCAVRYAQPVMRVCQRSHARRRYDSVRYAQEAHARGAFVVPRLFTDMVRQHVTDHYAQCSSRRSMPPARQRCRDYTARRCMRQPLRFSLPAEC